MMMCHSQYLLTQLSELRCIPVAEVDVMAELKPFVCSERSRERVVENFKSGTSSSLFRLGIMWAIKVVPFIGGKRRS